MCPSSLECGFLCITRKGQRMFQPTVLRSEGVTRGEAFYKVPGSQGVTMGGPWRGQVSGLARGPMGKGNERVHVTGVCPVCVGETSEGRALDDVEFEVEVGLCPCGVCPLCGIHANMPREHTSCRHLFRGVRLVARWKSLD